LATNLVENVDLIRETLKSILEVMKDTNHKLTSINNFMIKWDKILTPPIVGIEVEPGKPTTHDDA
jgi:hypothetical protein